MDTYFVSFSYLYSAILLFTSFIAFCIYSGSSDKKRSLIIKFGWLFWGLSKLLLFINFNSEFINRLVIPIFELYGILCIVGGFVFYIYKVKYRFIPIIGLIVILLCSLVFLFDYYFIIEISTKTIFIVLSLYGIVNIRKVKDIGVDSAILLVLIPFAASSINLINMGVWDVYLVQLIESVVILMTIMLYLSLEHNISFKKFTELKEKEISTQEKLKETEIKNTLGLFTAGIAHNFRNILTTIQVSSDLVKMQIKDNEIEDLERTINNMDKAITNANVLISELMLISKDKGQNNKIFNINDSILDITGILGKIMNPSIKVETKLGSKSMIEADRVWIDQIFLNLISNAQDALSPNGRDTDNLIKISTYDVVVKKAECYRNYLNNTKYVKIQVEDNGDGIPEENLKKIFTSFYTTKKSGTGLGLSTIHKFIKENNGHIFVKSEVDKGTNFTIFWPLYNITN